MARIFRTEKLSLNGNIQLSSSATNELEIINSTGSTLMSKASIESDISSLQAQRIADEGTTDSDVSSLAGDIATNKGDLESDVSSLAASTAGGTAGLESDVSSLQAQRDADEGTTDSDVSSLAALIANNDVEAQSATVTQSSESKAISFSRTFASAPVVVAILRSSDASDPIMPCMVTAVSTTGCTVSFGDGIPSGNYTLEVIASIAG